MKAPDGMSITLGATHDGVVDATVKLDEVTHRCPPSGSGLMPCCDRTPFEVPEWHRLTLDDPPVTCREG